MHPRLPDRPLLDEDAGRMVRPYQVTRGRVLVSTDLTLMSLVTARARPRGLDEAHLEILELSLHPKSIAELSGISGLPAMAVKVLVSDLHDIQAVTVITPELVTDADHSVLEALLNGLQRRL